MKPSTFRPTDPHGVFLPAGDPLQVLAIRAPTTVRLFRDEDRISVFAEIYGTSGGRPHRVDVRAALRNEGGDVTTIGSMSRSSDELKKSGDLLHFEVPLPLMNLPPGRYVVSVEASSTAGGEPISRSVPFRVR